MQKERIKAYDICFFFQIDFGIFCRKSISWKILTLPYTNVTVVILDKIWNYRFLYRKYNSLENQYRV